MRSRRETTAQKLRGGFYTPAPLVRFSLQRLLPLIPAQGKLKALEPSSGDGAFVRGLAEDTALRDRIVDVLAIEPLEIEATKCRRELARGSLPGSVVVESAITWGTESRDRFDIAVGNPPFVRYQFVSSHDKTHVRQLGERVGISFAGVSNLWLPVLVSALSRLQVGGGFSFVVPTELLTGHAAARLRQWAAANFGELRIDLFQPGSFPEVLQEVAVFSGRRLAEPSEQTALTVVDHGQDGGERSWSHALDPGQPSWTRYLLKPEQLLSLDEALNSATTQPLGSLARFQVSIVTGANDFFSITETDREIFELTPWTRPLLPRIRHAPGLIYGPDDQAEVLRSGARGWLLDFSESAENPMSHQGPARYLRGGRRRGLDKRYKCRIRDPWFRVPHIERGSLLLSKRSHRFPKVIVNEAAAYTTDTIYRGEPLPDAGYSPRAISACFHSSLTLLTAELEGRSFGGGVLELVPSEIERLAVAMTSSAEAWIDRLDVIGRTGSHEELVRETDAALVRSGVLDAELLETLSEARLELMERRLARNERTTQIPEALEARVAA